MTAHETLPHRLESLEGFRVQSVLNDGKESGVVALLGTFPGCATPAVVKLSRPPIPLGDPDALAAATRLTERAPYSGMEYGYYHGIVDPAVMKSVSVDVLYPGCLAAETEEARAKLLGKHVSRNTAQAPKVVRETPSSYAAKHLPYARSIPEGALGWVHKILRKEKEVERLLYDDPDPEHGFLINVDPKWSTHPDTTRAGWRDAVAAANASESESRKAAAPDAPRANAAYANELYCLGLCHRRDVRSLRDLRGEHLPMLRAMLRKGREIAAETYGVPTESLRCFVHYPPQFYHFHAHFTHVAVDFGVSTERAHLLDDVIENLERDGEHYAKCGLTMRVGERDELWKRFSGEAS
jgi:m7GpppX diphosphatase